MRPHLKSPRSGRISFASDVGGTFTDIIAFSDDGVAVLKIPTSDPPSDAVVDGIKRLMKAGHQADVVSHATTLATNALLTRNGLAKTALVTNDGFRDVIEIGRQRRPDVYSLGNRRPPPLVERRDRIAIRCRMAADGSELEPLKDADVRVVARRLAASGFASVAVSFLNSYANATHEKKMGRLLFEAGFRGHVSISSEVANEYREYERTSTAVVNASLAPMMSGYLSRISGSLQDAGVRAPVRVMNSDGSTSSVATASSRPVFSIESGPVAGVVAVRRLARELGLRKVLSFDMGGTTAKAGAVIDGEAETTEDFEVAGRTHSGRSVKGSGYSVLGTFIDLAEVSAGGGTVAWRDEEGQLNVGPRSSGSMPGPACYGRGGTEPTVTDANILLGRLSPVGLLGGGMKVYPRLSRKALKAVTPKSRNLEETAKGIVRLVNDSMSRAISMVSVERGRDPREFTLVAFGGAGPVHACDLAEELGIREILVPPFAGLFSAYGLLAGDTTATYSMPVSSPIGELDGLFETMERSAVHAVASQEGTPVGFSRSAKVRYRGQAHELLIDYKNGSQLRRSFARRHAQLYGYSSDDPIEVVSIRTVAVIRRSNVSLLTSPAPRGMGRPEKRAAWIGGSDVIAEVYDRGRIIPGTEGKGPCILEDYDSTLIVNPSWRWGSRPSGVRLWR